MREWKRIPKRCLRGTNKALIGAPATKPHVRYVGVYHDRSRPGKPWKAVYQKGSKYHFIGRFRSDIAAASAYDNYLNTMGLEGTRNLDGNR